MMRSKRKQIWDFLLQAPPPAERAVIALLLWLSRCPASPAQTLTVLHAFGSQQNDGANPVMGVTIDGHRVKRGKPWRFLR
jgi:hypothetical protein